MAKEDAEESESDMDDDAMFHLDEVLCNIMRARKAEKSQNEIDPRGRALSLLLIYTYYPGADPLILLRIIEPVMQVANEKPPTGSRYDHNSILHTCSKILLSLKLRKSGLDGDRIKKETSMEAVVDLLQALIPETAKVHQPRMHSAFLEAVLFVERVLIAAFLSGVKEQQAPSVRKIFAPIIENFATKRGSAFAHLMLNGLLVGLGDLSAILLPEIFEIMTCWNAEKKYVVVRQIQLKVIAENILRTLSKPALQYDEFKASLMSFGKEFMKGLSDSKEAEGYARKRKLMEVLVDFAR